MTGLQQDIPWLESSGFVCNPVAIIVFVALVVISIIIPVPSKGVRDACDDLAN